MPGRRDVLAGGEPAGAPGGAVRPPTGARPNGFSTPSIGGAGGIRSTPTLAPPAGTKHPSPPDRGPRNFGPGSFTPPTSPTQLGGPRHQGTLAPQIGTGNLPGPFDGAISNFQLPSNLPTAYNFTPLSVCALLARLVCPASQCLAVDPSLRGRGGGGGHGRRPGRLAGGDRRGRCERRLRVELHFRNRGRNHAPRGRSTGQRSGRVW